MDPKHFGQEWQQNHYWSDYDPTGWLVRAGAFTSGRKTELYGHNTRLMAGAALLGQGPRTGAELLFEVFSQRYERGSILVTTNLPFDEWTEVFGSERLTGALLDRLTHRVHILEMNGESYRLRRSRENAGSQPPDDA